MKTINPVNIEAIIQEHGIELDKKCDFLPTDVLALTRREGGEFIFKYKILINRLDNYHRKRFTMAHALGHCLLHRNAINEIGIDESMKYRTLYARSDLITDKEEKEANRFALNLLLPDNDVLEATKGMEVFLKDGSISPNFLKYLSTAFQVPKEVMAYKINKLRDKI